MMNEELFIRDLHNSVDAIEHYIITIEEALISRNAGDDEWCKLEPYKDTLNNLKFMISIYDR